MFAIALGFVAGAWLLQQQPSLPSLPILFMLLVPTIIISVGVRLIAMKSSFHSALSSAGVFILALLLGFVYAAVLAQIRLNDALPHDWEQKNIQVVGVVASMVKQNQRGERFLFDVEQVMTPDAQVPSKVLLNHYQQNAWSIKPNQIKDKVLSPNKFQVGERWQLTLKLKRPHTSYNPHGNDVEAWALAHHIRAMGTIRTKSGTHKRADFVWQPQYVIEYCRQQVATHIEKALLNKPYAGVIRALVIGDDSQISKHDWQVYLHTGVNHLMSIFYPLKRD